MFQALKTWLKNVVAVHPADGKESKRTSKRDYYWPFPIFCKLWESYARANDPRLLQELHRLAQKGERRYQDAFWYAATQGRMKLAVTLLEYDVTATTDILLSEALRNYKSVIKFCAFLTRI